MMDLRKDDGVFDGLARAASDLAKARGERANSAHLLAALFETRGRAPALLKGQKASSASALLLATQWQSQEDPFERLLDRATQLARSMRAARPEDVHVLLAMLNAQKAAGREALKRDNVDMGRLRALAMNAGLGLVASRSEKAASRQTSAVSVPLMSPVITPRFGGRGRRAELEPCKPHRRNQGRRPRSQAGRFGLDNKRHKLLLSLGQNLTQSALDNEIDETVGRHAEVEQLLDVLAKHRANNPCLVGPSGVGKTSVVHALAQRMARDEACRDEDRRIVVQLPVSKLLSGTGARGALASKLLQLRTEVRSSKGRIVLFFDDIEQLLTADAGDELVSELKQALASGDVACIGTTTPEHYSRLVENDAGWQRLFTRVEVQEPTSEETSEILELWSRKFEAHHAVEIQAEALASAITWSHRYVPGRALPDKAIAAIDLAAARCKRRGTQRVAQADVAEVVSEWTRVPAERLMETDGERLLRLEQLLSERVVGHEAALGSISRILRRNAAGFSGSRPIGTFLLLGPTGVGKTETAKAVSEVLFGTEQAMTRLDLSEYSEAHAVARLIGAPPGYVGFEAGGQLTEAVRRRPYQVLLLDEVEKAHPEVLAAFLPVLDEGRLTDGRGRTVDFTHTVIFLTSNVGAREATSVSGARVGFGASRESHSAVPDRMIDAARQKFSPEFYNRLDETLVFGALTEAQVEGIATRLLQGLADQIYEQRDVALTIEGSVVRLLLAKGGFDRALGARPMKRAIARYVEAPLAEALLRGECPAGSRFRLSALGEELRVLPESVAAE